MIDRTDNNKFELVSDYKPTGDQPKAIKQLVSVLMLTKKLSSCWEQLELEKHLRFQM